MCKPGNFAWCTVPHSSVVRVTGIYLRASLTRSSDVPRTVICVQLFKFEEQHTDLDCPCITIQGTYLVEPAVSAYHWKASNPGHLIPALAGPIILGECPARLLLR